MNVRNILIIGGATGIGKEVALDFAKDGHNVCVADINLEALKKMINESNMKERLFPFEVDTSAWKSVMQLAKNINEKFNKIDVLVYSAGITRRLKFREIDWKTWKKTMAVNLHGLFYSIKAVCPILNLEGSVVIIGSGSALTGTGGGVQYAASKGGAFGLMRSLVADLGEKKININVVAPRVIESDMLDNLYPTEKDKDQLRNLIPIGRLGVPADISSVVKYLSSKEAKYIHGQTILLDGGRTNYLAHDSDATPIGAKS
jgi:3-oxoacyl-[acyl-carrier protein] reductase